MRQRRNFAKQNYLTGEITTNQEEGKRNESEKAKVNR